MSRSEVVLKRMASITLGAFAGLVLWLGFAVLGPYALEHPPGPQNPSLLWYVVYPIIPPFILLTALMLGLAAWRLWRHGVRPASATGEPSAARPRTVR
jgi:hypothetical protein